MLGEEEERSVKFVEVDDGSKKTEADIYKVLNHRRIQSALKWEKVESFGRRIIRYYHGEKNREDAIIDLVGNYINETEEVWEIVKIRLFSNG